MLVVRTLLCIITVDCLKFSNFRKAELLLLHRDVLNLKNVSMHQFILKFSSLFNNIFNSSPTKNRNYVPYWKRKDLHDQPDL